MNQIRNVGNEQDNERDVVDGKDEIEWALLTYTVETPRPVMW